MFESFLKNGRHRTFEQSSTVKQIVHAPQRKPRSDWRLGWWVRMGIRLSLSDVLHSLVYPHEFFRGSMLTPFSHSLPPTFTASDSDIKKNRIHILDLSLEHIAILLWFFFNLRLPLCCCCVNKIKSFWIVFRKWEDTEHLNRPVRLIPEQVFYVVSIYTHRVVRRKEQ